MERKNERYYGLVLTSRNVHYQTVVPVIEALQKKDWKIRVLHFERIWEKAEQLLSKTTRRRSLESFYTRPKSMAPNRTKSVFYDLSSKMVFHAVNFLRLEKPNIVIVMTDSTPPSRIVVLAGRLAKIPSLLLLHSGMVGRNYECPSFAVDRIAIPGESARGILRGCGVDDGRLVVTGYPSYDALVQAEKNFRKDLILKKLGLNFDKKTIVYTTENLPARQNEFVTRVICNAVKSFTSVQLVIKVHPSELDLSVYRAVTKELGLHAVITRDAPIYEVLFACDLVITGFSATALDGMILNKPVVSVNLTGFKDPLPFAESGAAIGVYREEDLAEAVRRGLYDEEARENLKRAREKFVYEQAYKLDGKATSRVVSLIEQMVNDD